MSTETVDGKGLMILINYCIIIVGSPGTSIAIIVAVVVPVVVAIVVVAVVSILVAVLVVCKKKQ